MRNEMMSQRRWAGWVVVLAAVGLLAGKVAGFLPEPVAAAAAPIAPAALAAVPATSVPAAPTPSWPGLRPLAACGLPDYVGVFQPGDAACQPSIIWQLDQLDAQLANLNVLAPGESLITSPAPADGLCPWVVMRDTAAAGARVCFTPEGSLYRNMGGARDAQWSWRLSPAGQWVLGAPAAKP